MRPGWKEPAALIRQNRIMARQEYSRTLASAGGNGRRRVAKELYTISSHRAIRSDRIADLFDTRKRTAESSYDLHTQFPESIEFAIASNRHGDHC